MKKLTVSIKLISLVVFLYGVESVQGMELENLSKKAVYGATSQSKPLQKKSFYPVGPGLDQTLNCFITLERKRVDGMSIRIKRELPKEIWQKIWDYLNQKDKLKFGSLSHSFEYIRQYVQLDICREKLSAREGKYFYSLIKTICDIREDTKIDVIKLQCKELLENNRSKAEQVIENNQIIKNFRHYTKTEAYKKLKYLEEVFGEPDTCNVWCIECKDEYGFICNCIGRCISNPCLFCCHCFWVCVCPGSWEDDPDDELSCYDKSIKKLKKISFY